MESVDGRCLPVKLNAVQPQSLQVHLKKKRAAALTGGIFLFKACKRPKI